MKRATTVVILLLLFILVPSGAALATSALEKVVSEGQTFNGDLTLFGEDLVLEAGGVVNGDVVILGGNADVAGTVNGDLVLVGGNLSADVTAVVNGECVLAGGGLTQNESPTLSCVETGSFDIPVPDNILSQIGPIPPDIPDVPDVPSVPEAPPVFVQPVDSGPSFFGQLGSVLGRTIGFGLLALLCAALLPRQLGQVGETITGKPVVSGTVGFLTVAAGVSLIALLAVLTGILVFICIGLLGIPIIVAMIGLLLGASLFGWVAVGNLFGNALVKRTKWTGRGPTFNAALGTAVLTMALGLIGLLPFWLGGFAGPLLSVILLAIGLGATTLTLFGSRAYPIVEEVTRTKTEVVMDSLLDDDDEPLVL